MLVTIDPRDARPLYLQIMDEIRRALVVGTLKPEQLLPSVRELASELVVNPRTVSQAYQELEREGVVYVRRGHGTFVSSNHRSGVDERRALARALAKRTLLEARRNGLVVDELLSMLKEVAAEEEGEAGRPQTVAKAGTTK